MNYTPRLEHAVRFATYAHHNQFRKEKEKLGYISHPFAVAILISTYTNNEDIVIAGLLHDVLEDTEISSEEIKKLFGDNVTTLVHTVSEPKEKYGIPMSWLERKEAYVSQITKGNPDALYIVAADKIHNLQSKKRFINDVGEKGENYFGGTEEDIKWFYSSIYNILYKSNLPKQLVELYKKQAPID